MNIHPRYFKKPSRALFTFAIAGCDPDTVASDEPSEALAASDPDQVGLSEPSEGKPSWDDGECGDGFTEAGDHLCIDDEIRQPLPYRKASSDCRDDRARICSMEDLHYLYTRSDMDSEYNPKKDNKQRWIGNYVDDDTALCGAKSITSNNDPDIHDFDGECWAGEKHAYWCCREEWPQKGGGHDDGWDDGEGWDDDDDGWDDHHDGGWDDHHDK